MLRRDRGGLIRFAPLQGPFAAGVRARHPELAAIDSLVLVEWPGDASRERVRVRSEAVLALASLVGGWWKCFTVFRVVPTAWLDAAYDGFARRRTRWFGRRDRCRVPTPEQRGRFLDTGDALLDPEPGSVETRGRPRNDPSPRESP